MSSVAAIPCWAKLAARERGAMTAIEKREVVVLSVVPLEGAEPTVTRTFSLEAYASDPDECWRRVLSLFKGVEA